MSLIKPITVLVSLSFVFSASAKKTTPIEDQRDVYLQASAKKWNVKSDAYRSKVAELQDYPLLPYFQLDQLQRNMTVRNKQPISEFLATYQGTPVDWPLRKAWLKQLIRSDKKQLFVDYYQPTSNKDLTCHYHNYRLELGANKDDVLSEVTAIWLTGKSLPKSCDPLLAEWTKAGYRSNELIWQRILLANKKRSHILVKYLGKQLPDSEQYLWTLWRDIRTTPAKVANLDKFNQFSKQETQVIVYGIKRLAFKDEMLALSVYEKIDAQGRLTPLHREQVLTSLVPAIARSDDPIAISWYENLQRQYVQDSAIQYKVAKFIENKDYQGVLTELQTLTGDQQKDRQWMYWQARSYDLLGNTDKAQSIYNELAKARSFYGFLAAAHVGDKSVLNHKPITMSGDNIAELKQSDAGLRAMELYHLKRLGDARREWSYWMRQLTEEQRSMAAKMAFEQGWYDRAIFTLTNNVGLNDLDVRFPMPMSELFGDKSAKHQISLAWAYAIARKESIFMSDATSSAGALGLMQVLPGTARYLTGNKSLKRSQLLQAETNVDIGFKYLKYLLDKFDNNIVLATAAYNAGPGKVNRWLKKAPNMTMEKWIETIPYKETRNYVKSVMAFTEIYMQKLGQERSPFVDILDRQIH
ncbi:transglycosylase SLT domain-containing protein [Thalassotalea sp. Y01]|uniref:transglycosylase SLT domain-containing protein n=1 Tax=Thalassotalea sp. Y01 TaxID=2729613 RepID=UPI00145DA72C|nr:transglycosylase SLT domain-containing protein [Thalassotalea sp. Y01]NMP17846.1 transglycosylase SLT domain-containing protein [Thalassotalea sp. Y01]